MNDVPVHIALFAFISVAIVAVGAMYSEMDDRAALRALPRRLLWFIGGSVVVGALLLVLEHTVASVS